MATAKYNKTIVDQNTLEQFRSAFNEGGMSALRTAVVDNISAWEKVDIQIAITGNTGSGKSSLINALRGLDAESDGAAPVGVNETTTEINPYQHPKNKNFIFCDLPGVGSVNFLKESYLQTIDFDIFDVFIIVSAKRCSDNDVWLANEIASRNKKVIYVRTRVDNDVRNNARSKRNKKPEKELLISIREDCQKQLKAVYPIDIFLVDSYKRDAYDFPLLQWKIVEDVQGVAREAILMSFEPLAKEILSEKFAYFTKRVWKISFLAAIAPRLGDVDIDILLEEKEKYRSQFCLEVPLVPPSDRAKIQTELSRQDKPTDDDASDAEEFDEIRSCFPFLAFIYNQVKTYKVSKKWLNETLKTMYSIANDRYTSK